MKKLLLPLALLIASPLALAKTECTTAERSTWQDAEAFQANLRDQGYQIKKFKVTEGNCYEIYGYDAEQRKVEIYFNPVSGEAVKTKMAD
ncbi:PepSY domain-containing protein [Pseudomonas sp. NW5]|uniref:PepSY domain-containing protein n=1 Tax=Pseudomonas sp. NW5 TaxID=2934934 RepID=UPI00202165E4|nr:PepSY domain-containing protein [Pseudomonas sp. NW5]MCL7461821.1 PepSY domain-containing protein [Pseudomonas sp. NW5]